MDIYRTILVDDEERGRDNLSILLKKYCPEIDIIAEAGDALLARELILQHKPDVVFLDVQMPELGGFELLETLHTIDFAVVIVTAYAQYGIQAVKAGALDYVLKPIVIRELQQAVKRIADFFRRREKINLLSDRQDRITLTHARGFTITEVRNLLRLEADGNYTRVYTTDKKMYLVSKPLKIFDDNLKQINFFRIHRSYIINLFHVREYLHEDGGIVIMDDDTRIQLPKSRHTDFTHTLRKLSISI